MIEGVHFPLTGIYIYIYNKLTKLGMTKEIICTDFVMPLTTQNGFVTVITRPYGGTHLGPRRFEIMLDVMMESLKNMAPTSVSKPASATASASEDSMDFRFYSAGAHDNSE